jgi:phosphomannomutase
MISVRYNAECMTHQLPEAYQKAFKDADIRGVYPTEINEVLVERVANAFVTVNAYSSVVVGCDMRLSSPILKQAFIAGARAAGATVIDLGLVATPQLYFASGSLALPGVMITASHSPKEYNGLKLVHPDAIPLTKRNGLQEIFKMVQKNVWNERVKRGVVKKKNIDAAYQKFVFRGVQGI